MTKLLAPFLLLAATSGALAEYEHDDDAPELGRSYQHYYSCMYGAAKALQWGTADRTVVMNGAARVCQEALDAIETFFGTGVANEIKNQVPRTIEVMVFEH